MPCSLPVKSGAIWKFKKKDDKVLNVAMNVEPIEENSECKKKKDKSCLLEAQCSELLSDSDSNQRMKIGTIVIEIMENPERKISYLKWLLDIQSSLLKTSLDKEKTIPLLRLIITSLLTVFCDIIPSYPIRTLTETEKLVKVSKEVISQRAYEFSILDYYRRYVEDLLHFSKALIERSSPYPEKLSIVSTKALIELVTNLSHFNYRDNILNLLFKFLLSTDKKAQKSVNLIFNAIGTMLEKDKDGFVTNFILRVLSDSLHKKAYMATPLVLELLLKINESNLEAVRPEKKNEKISLSKRKKQTPYLSKKAKKKFKQEIQWRKELEANEAVISAEQKTKMHQDNLVLLFKIYFGVLKLCPPCATRLRMITGVCSGLAKYSFLIDSLYFSDLILCLKPFADQYLMTNEITQRWELCIYLRAIFAIASYTCSVLGFDLAFYYKIFYKFTLHLFQDVILNWDLHPARSGLSSILPKKRGKKAPTKKEDLYCIWSLHSSTNHDLFSISAQDMKSFKECFVFLFSRFTNIPACRVAAFAHLLFWVLLGKLDVLLELDLISILTSMGKAHPSVFRTILADETDSTTGLTTVNVVDNIYNPITDDPDQCHALGFSARPFLDFMAKNHPNCSVRKALEDLLSYFK